MSELGSQLQKIKDTNNINKFLLHIFILNELMIIGEPFLQITPVK